MNGIDSGGIFGLSGNCFLSSLKFLWKFNHSRNFVWESGPSSPGISTGIASDQASRYVRTGLPSEGISD